MKMQLQFGEQNIELRLPASKLLASAQHGPTKFLADPAQSLRECLEKPTDYPALRLALTPDDHVAIVIDPGLPQLETLLSVLMEHLQSAGIQIEAVTLVLADEPILAGWRERLGPWKDRVTIEIHEPKNRDKLSYLAATEKGRRVYINRTVVDADQAVVLARAGYDWARGYTGAAAAIFPALSDEATRQEFSALTESFADGRAADVFLREGEESAWLLGAPFFIQVIEGTGDAITHIVAGANDSLSEGRKQLESAWLFTEKRKVTLVVGNVTGSPDRLDVRDLAGAAAKAACFAETDGVVAILYPGQFVFDEALQVVCHASDATEAVRQLHRQKPQDPSSALQWISAIGRTHVYLLTPAPSETVEEMLAVPLDKLEQLQKLVDAADSVLILSDPHKIVAGPALAAPEKAGHLTKGVREGRSHR